MTSTTETNGTEAPASLADTIRDIVREELTAVLKPELKKAREAVVRASRQDKTRKNHGIRFSPDEEALVRARQAETGQSFPFAARDLMVHGFRTGGASVDSLPQPVVVTGEDVAAANAIIES